MRIITCKLLLLLLFANSYANIPLPSQNVAQNKGLAAGMGFGFQGNAGCKTLWTWTGQGSFYYNPTISAGASIKFLGGNLDSANNLVNQRYSLNAKAMHRKSNYVLFIGPVFSFENTDLSELRKEISNIRESGNENPSYTECRDLFSKIGSSLGYQSGAAFLLTPNWGVAFGHNLDLTFKNVFIASFSGSIAFNLRDQFEKLIENTKNFWLSLEYSITQIENKNSSHNFILGTSVGF